MLERSSSLVDRAIFPAAYLIVLAAVAAICFSIVRINDGTFVYALDDAYIHLSVSEQIWHGNYGINNGEFSAPASSILYPLLLALAAPTRLHQYVPLALNVAALLLSLHIFRAFLLRTGFGVGRLGAALAAIVIVVAALTLNLVGLVFSGMEHSLHIAVTAALILGLIIFAEEDRVSWWFLASIVAGPLIRYEGMALSVAAIACLAFRGRWRLAATLAILLVAALGSFSAFLVLHGLPPLPSSVLVKSSLAQSGIDGSLRRILGVLRSNLVASLNQPIGLLLAMAGTAGLAVTLRDFSARTRSPDWCVGLALAMLAFAHVVAGRYGWLERYEIYAVVGCVMMLVYLARPLVRTALTTPMGRSSLLVCAVAGLGMLGWRYVHTTATIFLATNNVYEQQYQMHRFLAQDYGQAVAVNDIGWTSYRNDAYVLDLWGLGSERARTTSETRWAALDGYVHETRRLASLDEYIQEKKVGLAMIYSNWFFDIPAGWVRVGRIHLSRNRIVTPEAAVDFYATGPHHVDDIRMSLQRFAQSLPSRIWLEVAEKGSALPR